MTDKVRSFWNRVWTSIASKNPLRRRKRTFDIVNKTNAYGISNSLLRDLVEKRGTDATKAVNNKFGSVHQLVKLLGSDEKQGLSSSRETIKAQQDFFGENVIPPVPPQSLLSACYQVCKDKVLVTLLVCAIISIAISFYRPTGQSGGHDNQLEWIEGVAILAAMLIVVIVTGVNDWQKDKKFRSLQDKIEGDKEITVIRDGKLQNIAKADLVVGDIYVFKYGDLLQADGFLIQGHDVRIDESSLTGESDLIKKNENNIIMLSGTNVMEGGGRMVVAAVGINSQIGIILKLLESGTGAEVDNNDDDGNEKCKKPKEKKASKDLSVLQIKLGRLAQVITYAGMAAALLTFVMLILRFAITTYGINREPFSALHIRYLVDSLTQAITVIVVAVPEGLPLAVTLALAFALMRMLKDNNLVRHLNACETMGNATTICSDKTGTLTTNRMTVTQCYISGTHYNQTDKMGEIKENNIKLLCEAISVNTSYSSTLKPSSTPGELIGQLGNKTECGLLAFVNELGHDYVSLRKQFPEMSFHKVFCFNSARKMMTTVLAKPTGYFVYTKGAPEVVLPRCTGFVNAEARRGALTGKKLKAMHDAIEEMSRNGLRTICIAYRMIPLDQGSEVQWDDEDTVVHDMICICIAGIQDPVRSEVPDAIRKCQRAGVVVRMVTGDNVNTARSIAQQCGIIRPDGLFLVLESSEFNTRIRDKDGKFSQSLFDEVWPNLRVLARSSPQDKYILVNGIVESKVSAHREVVAVTGDGTNDAPALKRADVGFAMGIQGTDVAKEACDIILTDDNFTSIVKALMWGRNVYDNVAKFLQFQLTANVAAGFLSIICSAAIGRVPLTAIQMLWVNLVMDTLASIALSSERPTEELLERKPYGRTRFIISPTMLRNILGHSAYQLTVMFLILFAGFRLFDVDSEVDAIVADPTRRGPSQQLTMLFNSFVLMTLFNEINARKLKSERNVFKGVFSNWIFIGVWVACIALQVILVMVGGLVFSVAPITLDLWAWCIFFGVGSLIFNQFLITIPVKPFVTLIRSMSKLSKSKSLGSKSEISLKAMDYYDKEDDTLSILDSMELDERDSAVLWYRGIDRVRMQANTIAVFQRRLGGRPVLEVPRGV